MKRRGERESRQAFDAGSLLLRTEHVADAVLLKSDLIHGVYIGWQPANHKL